ncbi:MAG: hypothetical protein PHW31_03495 [Candidatus Pacebacteria bacterium]|nr:hypothetical protein [Candidatus Paceibacterota bacterium]
MFTKEKADKILKKEGDARGVVFQTDANYILKLGSQNDLIKVENKLKEWGIGFHYKEVRPMGWYPVSWRVLSLLAIQESLGWNDEQIREIGRNAPKVSIIVKLFFKLFPDIEKFAQQIPNYWRKHYTIGELMVEEIDKSKQAMIIRLKDFSFHPLLCRYLEGYFEQATKLTRPEDSVVTAKEIQCSFHEKVPFEAYQLNWTK